ncbi:MAG: fibronectin type III domain-containing protein [Chitinophagaceae bacterium]
MHKVKTNFSRLSIPDKARKAASLVTALTGNENFSTPKPALETLTATVKALDAAKEAALDGGKSKTEALHACEDKLDAMITTLAGYVQSESEGDKAKILSSGFEVREKPKQGQPLENPENVHGKPGTHEGEVIVNWDAVDNARSYKVEMSTDGTSEWRGVGITTSSKLTLNGLVSGAKPWFRVSAIGPLGESGWSDVGQGKVN